MPGVVILLIALSLHFLSDGIREALDPAGTKVSPLSPSGHRGDAT
jgi:hypothetical protein